MTKTRTPQKPETRAPIVRAATKLETLISALQRPEGCDMATMIAATGWQAHSIRGAIAGAVRKHGHAVGSEKVGDVRVWRITAPAEAAG